MSYPPHGPPPPPYYGHPPAWPPIHHLPPQPPPYPSHSYPPPPDGGQIGFAAPQYPPPPDGGAVTAPQPYAYPMYFPGTMMIPVPIGPMPPQDNQTYITNYIYNGESSNTTSNNNPEPAIEEGKAVELSGEFDWVPTTATTASHLTGKAVVGGHEGWDGSPLWVIRTWHSGDLIPGKFSIRHNAASVVYDGKEIGIQNIEVLVANPENLRWIPASNGNIPPGAIAGGRTGSGETLYVGRARHQLSITPGKVQPSHNACYIAFAGTEVAHKTYDVLCRVS